MIYFWSKYNNIRMDFSDFSDFIGPIIFGLIAWLSNYFGKKKKQPKDIIESEKKKSDNNENFNVIFDDMTSNNDFFTISDENIIDEKTRIKIPDEIKLVDKKSEHIKEVKSEENVPIKKEKVKINKLKFKKITIKEKLKNRNSLKDAIILKEILDRKY